MKVLITGGAGFIGYHLAKELSENHEVSIVDFKSKIEKIKLSRDIKAYRSDISSEEAFESIPRDFNIIVHCAAQTGGYYSLLDPRKDAMWNSVGTSNLVNFSKKCIDLERVIYTSSMAVYGEGLKRSESDNLSPISFYGCSKLSGEFYFKSLKAQSDIDYVILRLWNTYGPGQDMENKHQGMLSIYLDQALKGDIVKITGSKNRIRDFVHVDDVVSAIKICMEKDEASNQIFNICSGEESTSEDIITEIGSQLGKNLSIEEISGYVGDQQYSSGNNDKIIKIGWKVSRSLREGISEFIGSLI